MRKFHVRWWVTEEFQYQRTTQKHKEWHEYQSRRRQMESYLIQRQTDHQPHFYEVSSARNDRNPHVCLWVYVEGSLSKTTTWRCPLCGAKEIRFYTKPH